MGESRLLERVVGNLRSPVAVLCGGNAAEREVSLNSGNCCYQALCSAGISASLIDTRDDWMAQLREGGFQHSFIALHGPGGEDGTIQGALEYLGVSYTGSGVLASALAMDKSRCKLLWGGLSLPTPESQTLHADSDWQGIISALGGRVIVKPAHEGSSIGMGVAATAGQLQQAWRDAAQYDADVFAERWIEGNEYTVAILGDEPLPVIRLETDNVFYDFEAKYLSAQTRYHIPCGLGTAQEDEVKALAMAAYRSLACTGWGRVDVLQEPNGAFQLIEVNTVPGMTDHSLVPMAAAARGMAFVDLVLAILEQSLSAGTFTPNAARQADDLA
jgi:D-alanine-D-alanine ligase